jgi:peptidoglycan-associated lipoprotein
MSLSKTTLIATLMAIFLSACTKDNNPNFMDSEPSYLSTEGYDPYKAAETGGYNTNPNPPTYQGAYQSETVSALTPLPLTKDTIYFLYDSREIQPQFHPIINKYSNYLRTHPKQILVLEGHADERGSREYNVALGEERAKAVARMMQTKGVLETQLEFVSYGEEKPASLNHNESAWRLNRRVHLIYQRK